MTLVDHVDALRRLAQLAGDTTVLEMAMLNVLEDLAATVDRLTGEGSGEGTSPACRPPDRPGTRGPDAQARPPSRAAQPPKGTLDG